MTAAPGTSDQSIAQLPMILTKRQELILAVDQHLPALPIKPVLYADTAVVADIAVSSQSWTNPRNNRHQQEPDSD